MQFLCSFYESKLQLREIYNEKVKDFKSYLFPIYKKLKLCYFLSFLRLGVVISTVVNKKNFNIDSSKEENKVVSYFSALFIFIQ